LNFNVGEKDPIRGTASEKKTFHSDTFIQKKTIRKGKPLSETFLGIEKGEGGSHYPPNSEVEFGVQYAVLDAVAQALPFYLSISTS